MAQTIESQAHNQKIKKEDFFLFFVWLLFDYNKCILKRNSPLNLEFILAISSVKNTQAKIVYI